VSNKVGVLIPDSLTITEKPFIPFSNLTSTSEQSSVSSVDMNHIATSAGLDGLDQLVNEMAFQFWECSHCLSMGHKSMACTNEVRCKECFIMGTLQKMVITNLPKKLSGGFPNSKSLESMTRILLAWLQPLSFHLSTRQIHLSFHHAPLKSHRRRHNAKCNLPPAR
jgi:hypothetical protein